MTINDSRFRDKQRPIDMYIAGHSVKSICEALGVSKPYVNKLIKESGIKRRPRVIFDVDSAIDDYVNGMSEQAVAIKFGVDRGVIRRTLGKRVVQVRTAKEASLICWSNMTKEQRANQVSAAHQSIREKPSSFHKESAIKQAISKQSSKSKVGKFEAEFIAELEILGHRAYSQIAVGPYNLDISINNTAIEIHVNSAHPHNHVYYRNRIVKLLKAGWNVIYIKIIAEPLIKVTANNVSRMINLIESDKSSVCHYGMIRGSGEIVTSGCLDGNELATVNTLEGFFAAIKS